MASKNSANLSKLEPQSIPLLALPFVPFNERKRLPRLTAIYFVLNADGTVLYVGQSINLAMRWAAHHRTAKLIEHQATRIAWLVMDDATLLNAVEAACISYFAPLCNGFHDGRHAGRPASDAAEFIPFPTRFPKEILDAIKAQAAEGRRPINTQILILVEQALAQTDASRPPRLPPQRPRRATTASF